MTHLAAWRSGGFEYVDDQEQRSSGDEDSNFGKLTTMRDDRPLPLRPKPTVTAALNVKDIGAVGDCRHDDTAVISKALAMHDVVFLPATAGQVSFFRPCLSDYLS